MENNLIPQQGHLLTEMANAYQENGIYEQDLKIENSCEFNSPEPDEWDNILDKMIKSFEIASNSDFMTEEQSDEFREGFNLFNEYFFALWW